MSSSPGRAAAPARPASRISARPAPRRRRRWLIFALAGAACARLLGADPEAERSRAGQRAAPSSSAVSSAAGREAPIVTASLPAPSGVAPGSAEPGAAPPSAVSAALAQAVPLEAPEPFALMARPVIPGRTWQDAANVSDWPAVALLIDGLPEAERSSPATRYARALAARELGQHALAVAALEELEGELPLLASEIASLRAHCQLEAGPYDAAFRHFSQQQDTVSLTLAARAALKEGDLVKAEQTLERALGKLDRQGEGKRALQKEATARALRAEILEARGQPAAAARDHLWLATQVPTDDLGAMADEPYERLSGAQLGSTERLERLRAFAREGHIARTLREHARLSRAPGPPPPAVEVTSALAWAYYHSRQDYARAAELFAQAAELSPETRAKFMFFTARALSRAGREDSGLAVYRELVRRFPVSAYTEQAHYRIANLEYTRGRFEEAERAYTEYLDRYARGGGGQYAGTSRYELAITRIGLRQRAGEAAATLGQLARKERRAERRAVLSHLEAVALEATGEAAKVAQATARYRSLVNELPLSFAALASAARLRALGAEVDLSERLGRLPPLAAEAAPPLPEKAQFLANLGLHTDAERVLFAERVPGAGDNDQTLCQMYGALDRGFASLSLAGRLLRAKDVGPVPSATNLWAWRCAYPEPYLDVVRSVETRYRLPSSLVHAVMRQESSFRPNVVSPAGAVGLMQLMPNTARRAAEEIRQQPGAPWVPDPARPTHVINNVELGGFYLGKLLAMLGNQVPVAVAAYNAGPQAVSSWLVGSEELPLDVWVARIPFTETRDYVSFVLGNWVAYRYLADPSEVPQLPLALVRGVRATPDAY